MRGKLGAFCVGGVVFGAASALPWSAREARADDNALYVDGILLYGVSNNAIADHAPLGRADLGLDFAVDDSGDHLRAAATLSLAPRPFWGYLGAWGAGGRVEWMRHVDQVAVGLGIAVEEDLQEYEPTNRFSAGIRLRADFHVVASLEAFWVPAHSENDPEGSEELPDIYGVMFGIGLEGRLATF